MNKTTTIFENELPRFASVGDPVTDRPPDFAHNTEPSPESSLVRMRLTDPPVLGFLAATCASSIPCTALLFCRDRLFYLGMFHFLLFPIFSMLYFFRFSFSFSPFLYPFLPCVIFFINSFFIILFIRYSFRSFNSSFPPFFLSSYQSELRADPALR